MDSQSWISRVLEPSFFFGYLSYNHHRSRPPPRSHHPTATHVLRIDHSLHSESHPPFAPLRGVAARHVSATSSRFRTCEGVLHWRLLGALNKRDARAAYSRRIVAPSSSLRPLPLDRAAPAPLCSAQAIDLIQSITHSSALSLRAVPPRPLVHLAAASPCSEKKMGLEVRDMRRCPCLSTAPLGCRSARAGCKRSRLR